MLLAGQGASGLLANKIGSSEAEVFLSMELWMSHKLLDATVSSESSVCDDLE
jgi:hypothetical protein